MERKSSKEGLVCTFTVNIMVNTWRLFFPSQAIQFYQGERYTVCFVDHSLFVMLWLLVVVSYSIS